MRSRTRTYRTVAAEPELLDLDIVPNPSTAQTMPRAHAITRAVNGTTHFLWSDVMQDVNARESLLRRAVAMRRANLRAADDDRCSRHQVLVHRDLALEFRCATSEDEAVFIRGIARDLHLI